MSNLTFHPAPPPKRGRGGRPASILTDEVLKELRDNMGEWAVVHTAKNTTMTSYWNARYRDEGYVFVSRKNDSGGYDIWAAFEPEEERP